MKKPFKHFDLPTNHLNGEHYIPARARQSDEIERRRQLPSGTVLLEQQARGAAIASRILAELEDEDDLRFAGSMLATSGINSSFYSYAQNQTEVMRRRLFLPELANDETDFRETSQGMLGKVRQSLAETAELAFELANRHAERMPTRVSHRRLGVAMGSAALSLANIGFGEPAGESAYDVQRIARIRSSIALEQSRTLGATFGVFPSMAQLSDPDSQFSVAWRRTAPDGAHEAFIKVQEEVRNETIAA